MKYLLLLLLIGCGAKNDKPTDGLTVDERTAIEKGLQDRRRSLRFQFELDSIDEASRFKIELIRKYPYAHKTPQAEQLFKSHMQNYYSEWSEPYTIERDTAITLQKYLDYCKNFQKDPKTYLQFMPKPRS